MEWYLSRPLWQRLAILFGAVGLFVFFVFQIDGTGTQGETPAPTQPVTQPTQSDPAGDPSVSDPEAPETPDFNNIEPETTTELSPAELEAAQTAVHEGLKHYYAYSTNESAAKRKARLSQYLTTDLESLDNPVGFFYDDTMRIDIQGTTNFETPLSAKKNQYVTVVQVNVRMQVTTDDMKRPQILSKTIDVYVEASKKGSKWIITKIEEQEGTNF